MTKKIEKRKNIFTSLVQSKTKNVKINKTKTNADTYRSKIGLVSVKEPQLQYDYTKLLLLDVCVGINFNMLNTFTNLYINKFIILV